MAKSKKLGLADVSNALVEKAAEEREEIQVSQVSEYDQVFRPAVSGVKIILSDELAGVAELIQELEGDLALMEVAELEVARLTLLRNVRKVIVSQLDQHVPGLKKARDARAALQETMKQGYYVGAVKVRAIPQGHPLVGKLAKLDQVIKSAEERAVGYLDKLVAEQEAVCKTNGYLSLVAEADALRQARSTK